VKVRLPQGSVLRPLLFVIVMKIITTELRAGFNQSLYLFKLEKITNATEKKPSGQQGQ